jgi:hypothetical protein
MDTQMTMTKLALIALTTAVLAVGCGTQESNSSESEDPQPETTREAPEQTQYTAPTPGAYGSDPRLDGLYDECAAGDGKACEDLYWESPANSEYEAFGEENMGVDGTFGTFPETTEPDTGYQEMQNEVNCQMMQAAEEMSQEEVEALSYEVAQESVDTGKDITDILAERGYTC